jgi:hypothetical protein
MLGRGTSVIESRLICVGSTAEARVPDGRDEGVRGGGFLVCEGVVWLVSGFGLCAPLACPVS